MSFHGLTDSERQELADVLGKLAVFFTEAAKVARGERDAALAERDAASARAERAEAELAEFRRQWPDGAVLATHVSERASHSQKEPSDA